MNTTLIIMAAGIGSRYGKGIKQLAKIGPHDEIIMDYSIYDAIEAGFNKVVFIIRKDIEKEFKEVIGNRIQQHIQVEYVYQEITHIPSGCSVPEGRVKPWGTGQAILACKGIVNEPFVIINADDYYGKVAFKKLHDFLIEDSHRNSEFTMAMAGFILKNTLSDNGTVTRGICVEDEAGYLHRVIETKGIIRNNQGTIDCDTEESKDIIQENNRVSMNMWAGYPCFIDYLENGGKAMIFSDYTTEDLPNFDAVLENYGVQREAGIVFEGDNQHYAMQMPYYLVPTINSTDASSETVSGGYYVLVPYAQGIKKMDDVRDTVTINSILTTSDQAYSKTDLNSDTLEKEDGDEAGPFDLGVSITETLDDDKETQIVYYSTSNLMESQVNQMVSGGNEKLIIESLKWMTDTEDSATVSIPSKSLSVSYLTLTDYDAAFWKICTIGLIPGFFLVVGFAVWMKRRKA